LNAIEVNSLTKEFGSSKAVDNISFTVEEGEIFGFLGPNGAGNPKISPSSTVKEMLSTALKLPNFFVSEFTSIAFNNEKGFWNYNFIPNS
jgi:ABC-type Na+ transport system ATPase subunit NatA